VDASSACFFVWRRADEASALLLSRTGVLGSEEFKQQKLEDLDGQVGQPHFGQLRLEEAQAKSERIIGEELRRLGWREPGLAARRKHHARNG
jgi:hypothetical protein